jgi:hypothetical protein
MGECVVILDNQKRALTMTMVTMEVAFTYNENDSFNQELKKTAISYTAAVSSPPGEGAPMNQCLPMLIIIIIRSAPVL